MVLLTELLIWREASPQTPTVVQSILNTKPSEVLAGIRRLKHPKGTPLGEAQLHHDEGKSITHNVISLSLKVSLRKVDTLHGIKPGDFVLADDVLESSESATHPESRC